MNNFVNNDKFEAIAVIDANPPAVCNFKIIVALYFIVAVKLQTATMGVVFFPLSP